MKEDKEEECNHDAMQDEDYSIIVNNSVHVSNMVPSVQERSLKSINISKQSKQLS